MPWHCSCTHPSSVTLFMPSFSAFCCPWNHRNLKTPKFVKSLIIFMSLFARARGARRPLRTPSDAVQPGLFAQITGNVWAPNLHSITGKLETKLCTVAAPDVLCQSLSLQVRTESQTWSPLDVHTNSTIIRIAQLSKLSLCASLSALSRPCHEEGREGLVFFFARVVCHLYENGMRRACLLPVLVLQADGASPHGASSWMRRSR